VSGNAQFEADSNATKKRTMRHKPTVHFELDLSDPVDHSTAVVLVERAIKVCRPSTDVVKPLVVVVRYSLAHMFTICFQEPGENWLNETLDGQFVSHFETCSVLDITTSSTLSLICRRAVRL
jgi:hypothetical protein